MAKVVIIGTSTGGLPAAYEIKNILGSRHDIIVISNIETLFRVILHLYAPSSPGSAAALRRNTLLRAFLSRGSGSASPVLCMPA